ncbi:hypothetical protein WP7S18E06_01770 [Aeromonas hydrophila]|jgi:UDPglucose--hexose-1-phosphate uridylyltransferase|nr:hypothetical protein WP7S18E06_01770 [Aeromonas hydrophila]
MKPSQCVPTPEQAAERLRALSPIHYNQTNQANEEAL